MLTEKQYLRLLSKAESKEVLVIAKKKTDAITMQSELYAIVKRNWPAFMSRFTKVGNALFFKAHKRIMITTAKQWHIKRLKDFEGIVLVEDDFIDFMPQLEGVTALPLPLKETIKQYAYKR